MVAAAPTAAPAKFAIQITAKLDGKATSLYLAKGATGAGTADLKNAASCSINAATNLVCDGKNIGAAPVLGGYVDMAPLSGVSGPTAINDGFSVDENMVLRWKTPKFAELPQVGKAIMEDQKGEAQWGLLRLLGSLSSPQLYSQLGCPAGTHNGLHSELIVGSNKVVPL
jgi:hypothetical protein